MEAGYVIPRKPIRYEFEVKIGENWFEVITYDMTRLRHEILKGTARVKKLTEEMIMREGWNKRISQSRSQVFSKESNGKNYILWFSGDMISIDIKFGKSDITPLNTSQIFRGFCQDINEFRTILSLLNI